MKTGSTNREHEESMKKHEINTRVEMSDFGRDGWTITSQVVGDGSSRIVYDYSFGDADIEKHILKSNGAMEYSSYFVIHRDLLFVLDYLEVIGEELAKDPNPKEGGNEILIIHGLFNAALITYFRAFSRGDGTSVRLNPKEVYRDKLLRRNHFRLKSLRDEGVAHWGDPSRDYEMHHQPVMILAKNNNQEVGYHLWSEISTPFYGMIDEFEKLALHLQNHIALKLRDLERQLLNGNEVLKIRHSELISILSTETSYSESTVLELIQHLQSEYYDSGKGFRLVGASPHSVQFTYSLVNGKHSDGLLLDCRYNDETWDIVAIPAEIEIREY